MSHRNGALQLVTVTPQMAAGWRATSRQRVRPEKVERIRAAMAHEWDPEEHRKFPVKIYEGRMVDGNHRMCALIEHGVPVDVWVERWPLEVDDG